VTQGLVQAFQFAPGIFLPAGLVKGPADGVEHAHKRIILKIKVSASAGCRSHGSWRKYSTAIGRA
jgi:hypothetical protein